MRKLIPLVAVALCLPAFTGGLRAEQIDNPQYASWAKLKPGSSVTYKSVTDTKMAQMPQPMHMETTMTQTLRKVEADALTVEVSSKTTMNGQEMTAAPSTVIIPAKVEKGKEDLPPEMKGEVKDVKTGKETIEVNGKKYATTTREYTVVMTKPMMMTQKMKVWNSPEVPGGLVKSTSSTATPMEINMVMTLQEIQSK
jgi:hypothetical protein